MKKNTPLGLLEKIDIKNPPQHIAIIMDGNGRWAASKGFLRVRGHREGSDSIRSVVRTCREIGVKYLSLYAFSVDNWKRPKREIAALMQLLKQFLKQELKEMLDNNVRLVTIGRTEQFPEDVQRELHYVEQATKDNDKLTVVLCLNYGGRPEIVDAVKDIADQCVQKKIKTTDIDEAMISQSLYTGKQNIPDPELLIRTSGEMRVSNFLLWQISYTELYVTKTLWPDFRENDFLEAIHVYQQRDRRFGGLNKDKK
ncbi:MAG: isoprenyl transferase [Candidatus Ancaeobacter aquaticus]|nr:isoprenyl transferase [Candidatus Ancaeobacter aquaticus]